MLERESEPECPAIIDHCHCTEAVLSVRASGGSSVSCAMSIKPQPRAPLAVRRKFHVVESLRGVAFVECLRITTLGGRAVRVLKLHPLSLDTALGRDIRRP